MDWTSFFILKENVKYYLIKKDIDLKDIVMQEAEVQDFKWASKEEIEKNLNIKFKSNIKT